ncbi:hypothetical protein SAMN05216178_6732 [Pseudomonas saponiphila]|jgi:hypothetical protein|uniref:Uncharacterized protein n=1 Tax=Pseudomonas saponiphila TaxID=556534 RepID=A0A1H4ZMD4_9PSED|nr:hypothetical protein [Pseudomonas saponiphila]SED31137.1 hypothetical protein SAMN05216178_6732 [Pseudomonas saponiphila]
MGNSRELSPEHRAALMRLRQAFTEATECGALDLLNDFHRDPDSINDVVESLEEALDHEA